MEVYDSFDRANFKVGVDSFFTSGSYVSQNTTRNHMFRLQPKNKQKISESNLYGNFNSEFYGNKRHHAWINELLEPIPQNEIEHLTELLQGLRDAQTVEQQKSRQAKRKKKAKTTKKKRSKAKK